MSMSNSTAESQANNLHPSSINVNDNSLERWTRPGLIVWIALLVVGLVTGPELGDHEVIVAQTARQVLASGEWLIPRYLDTPFLVKPPLAPWLVVVASLLSPDQTANGVPVAEWVARLPSALATILTVIVVWRLGRSMYGRFTAHIAAIVCATSTGVMLFALNATAEAVLTFFCTWAYAEFWWSQGAVSAARRRAHLARFYIALGLGMLTKGPMPLIVVAVPLAVWWWSERSVRMLAATGFRGLGPAIRLAARGALPRLLAATRKVGLWWGPLLLGAVFIPWLVYVAGREPYAWELWEYEFLDRARGSYPGCQWGDLHYYIPILFGMLIPWCLSLPEALAAPFLLRYRAERRPLTFAWHWVVVAVMLASLLSFKKPYYILPVAPGCALLLGPVLRRFFFQAEIRSVRRARWAVVGLLSAVAVLAVILWLVAWRMYPEVWHGRVTWGSLALAAFALVVLALACRAYLASRRRVSLGLVALTGAVTFVSAWMTLGPALANVEDPMAIADGMNRSRVAADTPLYWASNRPDGRVLYYGGRPLVQIFDTYKLIAELHDHHSPEELREFAAYRICDLLTAASPVYLVLQREDLEALMAALRPPAYELFSVDRGALGVDGEDWVVVTNQRPDTGGS